MESWYHNSCCSQFSAFSWKALIVFLVLHAFRKGLCWCLSSTVRTFASGSLIRAGSDSEALTFSVPHSPRSCLLLTPQMQVITDVYLSVSQTQDTCTAINSSFSRVNHSHVIADIIPTAHWESFGNIDGIYSLGNKFNKPDWFKKPEKFESVSFLG